MTDLKSPFKEFENKESFIKSIKSMLDEEDKNKDKKHKSNEKLVIKSIKRLLDEDEEEDKKGEKKVVDDNKKLIIESIKSMLDEDEKNEKKGGKKKEELKKLLDVIPNVIKQGKKFKDKEIQKEKQIPNQYTLEGVKDYLSDMEKDEKDNFRENTSAILALFVKTIYEVQNEYKGNLIYSIYNYLAERYDYNQKYILINFLRNSNNDPSLKIFFYMCILHNSIRDIDLVKDFIKEFLLMYPAYNLIEVVEKVLFFLKDKIFSRGYTMYFGEKVEKNITNMSILFAKIIFIYDEINGINSQYARQKLKDTINKILLIGQNNPLTYEVKKGGKVEKRIDYYPINIDAENPEQKEFAKYIFLEKKGFCHLNPPWINTSILFGKNIMLFFVKNDYTPSGYEIAGLCVTSSSSDRRSDLCEDVKEGECAEISTFCTSQDIPGLGGVLMDYSKRILGQKGYSVITLSSVDNAINFYSKQGYKVIKDAEVKGIAKRYVELKAGNRQYVRDNLDEYISDLKKYFISDDDLLRSSTTYSKFNNIMTISGDDLKLLFKIYAEAVVYDSYRNAWKDKEKELLSIEIGIWENRQNFVKDSIRDSKFFEENTKVNNKDRFFRLERDGGENKIPNEQKDDKETLDQYITRKNIRRDRSNINPSFGKSSIRLKLKKLEKIRGRNGIKV